MTTNGDYSPAADQRLHLRKPWSPRSTERPRARRSSPNGNEPSARDFTAGRGLVAVLGPNSGRCAPCRAQRRRYTRGVMAGQGWDDVGGGPAPGCARIMTVVVTLVCAPRVVAGSRRRRPRAGSRRSPSWTLSVDRPPGHLLRTAMAIAAAIVPISAVVMREARNSASSHPGFPPVVVPPKEAHATSGGKLCRRRSWQALGRSSLTT